MAKLRKEYNPDKAARRKKKPIIYIVCEGKETEILYFGNFRSRNCLVDVRPVSSKHRAAMPLVKHAGALISQSEYSRRDGDQLWCVFDCDDNREEDLREASAYARKCGYHIAFSNPSFEYWFLLHFEEHEGYLKNSHVIIDILKSEKYLKNYEKNNDVFDVLKPHMDHAVKRAENRIHTLQKENVPVISRQSNPVTTVHCLTEYLTQMQRG